MLPQLIMIIAAVSIMVKVVEVEVIQMHPFGKPRDF